ncbi:hypothetical protein E0198_004534 [Clavispora lusitaniae]|nr:hypothetical protein E0198_004534 [Clavispora lusitaniae]
MTFHDLMYFSKHWLTHPLCWGVIWSWGWRMHLSKQFWVILFTNSVALATANSCLIWSWSCVLTSWASRGAGFEPKSAISVEREKRRPSVYVLGRTRPHTYSMGIEVWLTRGC